MKRFLLYLPLGGIILLASTACSLVSVGVEWERTPTKPSQSSTAQLPSDGSPALSNPHVIPTGGAVGSTPLCEVAITKPLTIHGESSPSAEVSGSIEIGKKTVAVVRTLDGWIGFNPQGPGAGNEERAKLRWLNTSGAELVFNPSGCRETLPLVLSLASLDNGTYYANNLAEITLMNGKYENPSFDSRSDPGAAIHDSYRGPSEGFGDLDGDGDEDAVITLNTNTGGSGTFLELVVVLNDNGTPRYATSVFVGDREGANKLSVSTGLLTADLRVHGPNDGACCPSQDVTRQYSYQNNQLVEFPGAPGPTFTPTSSTTAPVILLLKESSQKGYWGDIYAWNASSQALKQLTSWGYNYAPRVSPDGQWLAYRSVSQAGVTAVQEQAMFAGALANIWLLNPYTEEAIRIADQPQGVASGSGKLINRYDPVWSPDGTAVAWLEGSENDTVPTQAAIYTLSSKSTTSFPLDLPSSCCEGAPDIYWGRSGIAVVNTEGVPPTQLEQVIYLFNTQGQRLARVPVGGDFLPGYRWAWVTDENKHEYLAGTVNGTFAVADPSGSAQPVTMQGFPEMYSLAAPDGLSVALQSFSDTWTARITQRGQPVDSNAYLIDNIHYPSDISVAPDGQAIVYMQLEGENPHASICCTNGQPTPISVNSQLRLLAIAWGATAWRIHSQ